MLVSSFQSKGAQTFALLYLSFEKILAAGKQSESEDDQPLTMIIKKKKQKADTEEPEGVCFALIDLYSLIHTLTH